MHNSHFDALDYLPFKLYPGAALPSRPQTDIMAHNLHTLPAPIRITHQRLTFPKDPLCCGWVGRDIVIAGEVCPAEDEVVVWSGTWDDVCWIRQFLYDTVSALLPEVEWKTYVQEQD